ncbi:HAD family hydrolase [Streptomyces hainanensis]|uniref:HAD family hydrolase n=1 Tax=Streptomyces hainanensis TaxID=402648 RepID=A0A4R4T4H8_9ACTN|nr:HAD family hydrolase [Streptomyces hainanensis]TDC71770.1 HAD family hydrolase [Streptomyces hainanensis]
MATHLVWDWNGTLLHDTDLVIAATNASFAELGIPSITPERYRELFCVPVPLFYERLLGRPVPADEWEVLDGVFHRHYRSRADEAALAEGAAELLAAWRAAGRTQSVCSLAAHDQLLPLVARLGIAEHFTRVDGSVGGVVAGKAEQMARHLAAQVEVDPASVVVIGDAVDDAVAAGHVGARAVLYAGGSHSRRSLARAGVPVVDSLAEAVHVAEELVTGTPRTL